MSNEEWARQEQDTASFLDSLTDAEILQAVDEEDTVPNIRRRLEDLFEAKYIQQYPNNKCLFNVWCDYDLQEYLEGRFNCLHFYEVCYAAVQFVKPRLENQ